MANDDLISRSALIQRLAYYHAHSYGKAEYAYGVAAQEVQNAPAVDAVPVAQGRWIDDGSKHGSLGGMCSQCHRFCRIAKYYEYCPHCGAKMDAKEGEHVP